MSNGGSSCRVGGCGGDELVETSKADLLRVIGIVHKPVSLHLVPRMTMSSLLRIITSSLLNVAVMPASQMTGIDNKAPTVRSGNMCARLAASGKAGMSSRPSCVDVMILPSGMSTTAGLLVSLTDNSWSFMFEGK
jgi:hypothetical protein